MVCFTPPVLLNVHLNGLVVPGTSSETIDFPMKIMGFHGVFRLKYVPFNQSMVPKSSFFERGMVLIPHAGAIPWVKPGHGEKNVFFLIRFDSESPSQSLTHEHLEHSSGFY